MFNPTEMLLLLAGVVIMVGGKKLPELGSGLGKGIKEFRKAVGEMHEGDKVEMAQNKSTVVTASSAEVPRLGSDATGDKAGE